MKWCVECENDQSARVFEWLPKVVGLTRGKGKRFEPIGRLVRWLETPQSVTVYGSKAWRGRT